MKNQIVFLLLSLSFFTKIYSLETSKSKIKVLIIDGQNNHLVWPKSTIMMKQYLEETGVFEVDIERTKYLTNSQTHKDWLLLANVPEGIEGKPETDPDFNPDFSKYDVVVSNFGFKAAIWSEETQRNFENYVKNGGGFVSVHAADNCFPEWEAYNKKVRERRKNRSKKKSSPFIYEENSIYENSFASKVENSFREDIHCSLQNLCSQNTDGSI